MLSLPGPYFYLFVNGLPQNEQRRKRACGTCQNCFNLDPKRITLIEWRLSSERCNTFNDPVAGLCSGGNQLVRQRDDVQRNAYGTNNRSSRDSVPYQHTPALSVESYLAPYMRRPSPITPLVPAQAFGTTAAQTLQQFPVIRDWLTHHIRPLLEHEIAYAPLPGSHQWNCRSRNKLFVAMFSRSILSDEMHRILENLFSQMFEKSPYHSWRENDRRIFGRTLRSNLVQRDCSKLSLSIQCINVSRTTN